MADLSKFIRHHVGDSNQSQQSRYISSQSDAMLADYETVFRKKMYHRHPMSDDLAKICQVAQKKVDLVDSLALSDYLGQP